MICVNELTMNDKGLLILEAEHLMEEYRMSYNQIAVYLTKKHGVLLLKQTIYRWLNL